jgi:chemotaxis protein MotB
MDFEDPFQHSGSNHERWMISWADFITLMFAVFVVLFCSATTNKNTAKEVSAAVMNALKMGSISFILRGRPAAPPSNTKGANSAPAGKELVEQQKVVEIVPSLKAVSDRFQQEIADGKIEMHAEPRGLIISLRQASFFGSGQANLNPDTYPIVDKIGALILSVPNRVNLEGHTDPLPIHNSHFGSNWELSAARSIAMLELLIGRDRIPRDRLSIAGFADTAPLDSNADPEGRAHNRRVDVVILNEFVPAQNVPAVVPPAPAQPR